MLTVGSPAPEFELPLKPGEAPLRLSDYRDERIVVLLFFPAAFSSVCTEEICTVASEYSSWRDLDAEIIGVSVDSPVVNQKFAADCEAAFPIVSDFNRTASAAYGILNDDFFGLQGVANRSAFVVGRDGTIHYAWTSEDAGVLPDFESIRRVLRSLH